MRARTIQFVLVFLLGLSVSSCAVMMAGEGHEAGTGLLTDAAIQAHPDSMTKFKLPPPDVGYTVSPPLDEIVVSGPISEPGFTSRRPSNRAPSARRMSRAGRLPLLASLVAGGGTLGGTSYDGFSTVGLALGGYPEPRLRLDASGSFNGVDFTVRRSRTRRN